MLGCFVVSCLFVGGFGSWGLVDCVDVGGLVFVCFGLGLFCYCCFWVGCLGGVGVVVVVDWGLCFGGGLCC